MAIRGGGSKKSVTLMRMRGIADPAATPPAGSAFLYLGDDGETVFIKKSNGSIAEVDISDVGSNQDMVVTPEAYGALGDGVTDDTDAIQDAIDAIDANGGGVVSFGAKTYLLDSAALVACANLKFVGVGSRTILKVGTNNIGNLISITANNVVVQSFEVLFNNVSPAVVAITATGVSGFVAKDLTSNQTNASYFVQAINCTRPRIENVSFDGGVRCVDLNNCTDPIISRCSMANSSGSGFFFNSCTRLVATELLASFCNIGINVQNCTNSLIRGITTGNTTGLVDSGTCTGSVYEIDSTDDITSKSITATGSVYNDLDQGQIVPIIPENFGAAGDGSTDDAAALQAAIYAAQAKGVHVLLRDSKNYLFNTTLTLPAGVEIRGETISGSQVTFGPGVLFSMGNFSTIRGFIINCDASTTQIANFTGDYCIVDQIEIKNFANYTIEGTIPFQASNGHNRITITDINQIRALTSNWGRHTISSPDSNITLSPLTKSLVLQQDAPNTSGDSIATINTTCFAEGERLTLFFLNDGISITNGFNSKGGRIFSGDGHFVSKAGDILTLEVRDQIFQEVSRSSSKGVVGNLEPTYEHFAVVPSSSPQKPQNRIAWNGTIAVALFSGSANQISISTNGKDWTTPTISFSGDQNFIAYNICYASTLGLFVMVGRNPVTATDCVATSSDGISWTVRTAISPGGVAGARWKAVDYSSSLSLLVAVGYTGDTSCIMTSPDGVTWTVRTAPEANNWQAVKWHSGLNIWVAVGGGGSGDTNNAMSSTNGTSWTIRTTPMNTQGWSCIGTGPSMFVVGSDSTGLVIYSSNGTSFSSGTNNTLGYIGGVIYSSDLAKWISVHEYGTQLGQSTDGITFDPIVNPTGVSPTAIVSTPELDSDITTVNLVIGIQPKAVSNNRFVASFDEETAQLIIECQQSDGTTINKCKLPLDNKADTNQGTAALSSGSASVNAKAIQAGSFVLLMRMAQGSGPGHLSVESINPGVGFTINSSNAGDDATIAWKIID